MGVPYWVPTMSRSLAAVRLPWMTVTESWSCSGAGRGAPMLRQIRSPGSGKSAGYSVGASVRSVRTTGRWVLPVRVSPSWVSSARTSSSGAIALTSSSNGVLTNRAGGSESGPGQRTWPSPALLRWYVAPPARVFRVAGPGARVVSARP